MTTTLILGTTFAVWCAAALVIFSLVQVAGRADAAAERHLQGD
ncbi:MAG: hypothetical protein QM617_04650 [Comamonas sp.]